MEDPAKPFIVGLGGTISPGSSTEAALSIALASSAAAGARVRMFGSATLSLLPHYLADGCAASAAASQLLDSVRQADGLIIASPGYHGSVSGLVKNALDYLEETSKDVRVYLDGLPVGVIATAYGWQAAAGTLATLRSIVHALRGWPTPLGVAINASGGILKGGQCSDPAVTVQLELVGRQVCSFGRLSRGAVHDSAGATALSRAR